MVPSEALCQDQHAEDDQQHAAEGDALQQVARRRGDHRPRRGHPRQPARRDLEAADVAVLEAEQLHVLDAARWPPGRSCSARRWRRSGARRSASCACARSGRSPRSSPRATSAVPTATTGCSTIRKVEMKSAMTMFDEQPHRRHQRLGDDLVDLGEHRLAEIGAVAVEEPGIGLAQVAAEQLAAQHVGAFVVEAGDRVERQEVHDDAHHRHHEGAEPEEDQEARDAGEVQGIVDRRRAGRSSGCGRARPAPP